ncbi:MAG TPA: transglycosylase SLT domain-containing protein [Casimicrobiaceae bacterium]|nr:transglycosylase SLT domain-containing protein [Casimicrobiaceae bacterium]
MHYRRTPILIAALLLAACATQAPQQTAEEAPPRPQPLLPVTFAPAPPKIVLVNPFVGDDADLEPLPLSAGDLWERIAHGYAIPDLHGPLVEKWEQWYAERPDYVARMVERSRRYLYHIVGEVEARGMPLEIALLPMVESAFNPNAMSVSRASGIWQFMPQTGKTYGLKQTWWFDSRRDVVAATSSALDYLQALNSEFNDWQLSLAGYNWGEGNVRKAIARNRKKGLPVDFESLANLPDETRNYLPKLQAVKNIVADPQKYGLVIADVPNAPYFTVVRTTVRMDVKRAADLAELPLDEFLALNPQHNRPVISGADDYAILLPIDKAEVFAAKLNLIDQPLVSWQAHRMKPGETLSQLATRYGMSIETLRSVNGIGPRETVPVGYALLVPMQKPTEEADASLENAVFTTVVANRTFHYVVHRGDSLTSIAGRFGVTTQDLKRWNRLSASNVRIGQKLRVTSDVPATHVVHAERHRAQLTKARAVKSRQAHVVRASGGGGSGKRKGVAVTSAVRAEK